MFTILLPLAQLTTFFIYYIISTFVIGGSPLRLARVHWSLSPSEKLRTFEKVPKIPRSGQALRENELDK